MIKRFGASLLLVLSIVFIPGLTHAATLNELQSKLNQAQAELQKYQELQKQEKSKAEQYSKNIEDTQKQIDSVRGTISSLQGQIGDKQKNITDTESKIHTKTAELNDLSNKVNESIETYYELTHLMVVESIAGDESLSQLNSRTEYLQALQNHSLETMNSLNKVKDELESTKQTLEQQKSQLAALKGEQEQKNSQLQQNKQKTVVSLTAAQRNEEEYRQKLKTLESEKAKLSQEIYTLRAAQSSRGKEKFIPATSDYPWASMNPDDIDPWDFFYRQCTSYAAFKWRRVFGFDFRPGYEGRSGDAKNWPSIARSKGYTVTSTPKAPSVISWPSSPVIGQYGHVAWVEAVNADGTIDVSEYNWNRLSFSYRKSVRYQDYGNASFITP